MEALGMCMPWLFSFWLHIAWHESTKVGQVRANWVAGQLHLFAHKAIPESHAIVTTCFTSLGNKYGHTSCTSPNNHLRRPLFLVTGSPEPLSRCLHHPTKLSKNLEDLINLGVGELGSWGQSYKGHWKNGSVHCCHCSDYCSTMSGGWWVACCLFRTGWCPLLTLLA